MTADMADGSFALIGEAYAYLNDACLPGTCEECQYRPETARLVAALRNRADAMLDAAPPLTLDTVETFLHHNIPGWRQAVALALAVVDREPTPWQRIGQQIKSDHWAAFNRGEWGTIVGTLTLVTAGNLDDPDPEVVARLCYAVRWPDGATDQWATDDPAAHYLFREPE